MAVPYSELFLLQAALQTLLSLWLVRIWQRSGHLAALVLLVPQLCLVYDNLIVGIGHWIGPGSMLEALSWPRFWTHWLFGAWGIAGCGAILRLAGASAVQSTRGMLLFCSLTLAMMMYDLPHFFKENIHAVCENGLVRYSTAVAEGTACFPGQPVVPGTAPFASICTLLVTLISGGWLLAKRRFPWMLIGGLLMFATTLPQLRALKLDNLGEVFFTAGIIWALARYAPHRPRIATEPA
ncbi:MAG: hypothetical protein ACO3A8_01655 [Steroidobacteraceae bacterium]|nr:hypothetical protein [Gammaproteobacteria bacterium]